MKCKNCPYKSTAITYTGPLDADFVIVGEAPGVQELATGQPFVGPSGQLLWSTLSKHNIRRSQCLVTNALSCRPDDVVPTQEGILACQDRLHRELAAYPRKVILALGNTAVRSITGDFKLKITNVRGRAIKTRFGIVVPTFHPAAILRQYNNFKLMAADISYAASLLNGGSVREPGQTRWVLATPENITDLINRLRTYPLLSADIETGGYSARLSPILCLGVCWDKNKVAVFPRELVHEVKPLLEDPNIRWVWHFGKFDTAFFHSQYRINARVDEDTGLISYALNEQGGIHDLETLAETLLGAADYKAEARQYAGPMQEGFLSVPKKVLHKRVSMDADYTWQLYHVLYPRLEQVPPVLGLYRNVLLPASALLRNVESRGLYIDRQALDQLRVLLEEERDKALQEVTSAVSAYWDPTYYAARTGAKKIPDQFVPTSPKQVAWVLYDAMKLKPPPGFKASTSEEVLVRLPSNPVTKALLNLRAANKTLSTYVEGFERCIEPDGRVHTTFLIHGTRNGRLSSRRPNVQNIDRRPIIRNIISAPPGRALLEVDYNQAELRCLAALSRDEWLINVYREGRDLHDEVSKAFYGENYTVDQKIRAKAVNFGIVYGRREYSLAKEHGMSIEEAARLIRDWFARMPKAHRYIEMCRQAVSKGKALQNPLGRRRRFGLVTADNINELQNEASNFMPASTASDLNLMSAIEIDKELTASPYNAVIVNLVHDSILIELDDDISIARQVFEICRRIMTEVPRRILGPEVPFVVEPKFGKSWGSLQKMPW